MPTYKILIIDDEINEREDIYKKLFDKEYSDNFNFELVFKDTYIIGQDVLDEFDACIIDVFLGGVFLPNGKDEMTAGDILKDQNPIGTGPVIIITSRAEEFIENNDFEPVFMNLTLETKVKPSLYLSYNTLENKCRDEDYMYLKNIRANVNRAILFQKTPKKKFDLLVITALQEEMDPFNGLVGGGTPVKLGRKVVIEYKYNNCNIKLKVLTVVCDKMGQVEMAYKLGAIKACYDFDHMVMIGVCGGVEHKVSIGDVIIPESSEPYDHVKINNSGTSARTTSVTWKENSYYNLGSFVRKDAHDIAINHYNKVSNLTLSEPKCHNDPMLSGSAVINRSGLLESFGKIVGNENSCSVDMESYAFYYFANKENDIKTSMVIKSVMDLAGGEKQDDYKTYCAGLSANVLYELIKKGAYVKHQ